MYVHVPSAWIGLACFSTIALLSILNFIFKIKNFYFINKSIAPIGLLFTSLSNSYWFFVGPTNMGNLVGMGCKINFNDNFNVFLYSLYFKF